MPIEIKELIIRATVVDESEKSKESTSSASASGNPSNDESIIKRCVEQIMEIIATKNER
ncbi:MAG TPA: DUF5908 family protein [Chryseolinea sp.]|nr:DUF5908 family protein [Chryseolinea sp.]